MQGVIRTVQYEPQDLTIVQGRELQLTHPNKFTGHFEKPAKPILIGKIQVPKPGHNKEGQNRVIIVVHTLKEFIFLKKYRCCSTFLEIV